MELVDRGDKTAAADVAEAGELQVIVDPADVKMGGRIKGGVKVDVSLKRPVAFRPRLATGLALSNAKI
jgi:hypothetical protein